MDLKTFELTQYINPIVEGKARQALRAHRAVAGVDSYKTVMCQTWLETAGCGFGPNCKFAHGEHELRPCRFPPPTFNLHKYKTKLCDKYMTRGICPYGRRCLFIHPEMASAPLVEDDSVANGDSIPPPLCIAQQAPPPMLQSRLSIWSSHEDVAHLSNGGVAISGASLPTTTDAQNHYPQHYQPRSIMFGCDDGGRDSGVSCAQSGNGSGETSPSSSNSRVRHRLFSIEDEEPKINHYPHLSQHHTNNVHLQHLLKSGTMNDSGGSMKELRETLAFSLGNVLDLSDVHL